MSPASEIPSDVRVRPYEQRDRSQIRKICADTGFLGNPIDPVFEDRELFSDFLTSPYTDAEPDCCYVWEGSDGRILGYVMGSRSQWKHISHLVRRCPGWFFRAVFGFFFYYRPSTRKYLTWLLFRGRQETPTAPSNAVHFHINLLPEARGLKGGKLLFDTFLDRMAELGESSVFGQIVVKGDRRTDRMFSWYGFKIIDRKELSKFREHRDEPVYLCTVVQERVRTPTLKKNRNRRLLLSFHDFHPGSRAQINEQMDFCLSRCPGHVSVLVIPQYHHGLPTEKCGESVALLDQWSREGHDLAVHGYYHDRVGLPEESWWWTRIYTQQEAEFFRLNIVEAKARIQLACDLWNRRGWRANGFVAPGWLHEDELENVLRAQNFRYTCRIGSVTHLQTGRAERAWAGTYSLRSGWRRGLARLWQPIWKRIWAGREMVRLRLHPVDLEVPFVRRQVGLLLEEVARQGYLSHSYAEHVEM